MYKENADHIICKLHCKSRPAHKYQRHQEMQFAKNIAYAIKIYNKKFKAQYLIRCDGHQSCRAKESPEIGNDVFFSFAIAFWRFFLFIIESE
jgi:hypothetical protein